MICRIETENTVEIESPDMFKETWADQLGVQASLNQQQESNNHLFKDARTIADAVGASITKPAAGAATTKEPTTTSTARIRNRRAGLFGGGRPSLTVATQDSDMPSDKQNGISTNHTSLSISCPQACACNHTANFTDPMETAHAGNKFDSTCWVQVRHAVVCCVSVVCVVCVSVLSAVRPLNGFMSKLSHALWCLDTKREKPHLLVQRTRRSNKEAARQHVIVM